MEFDLEKNIQETNYDKLIDNKKLKKTINGLLKELMPRQREILELRNRDYTLEIIGKMYGVTRERIRQIESKAISQLKHSSKLEQLREYH